MESFQPCFRVIKRSIGSLDQWEQLGRDARAGRLLPGAAAVFLHSGIVKMLRIVVPQALGGVRSGLVFEHFCKLSQVRSKWETHLLVIALSYPDAMTQLLLI